MSVQSINHGNLPEAEQVIYKNIKHLIQNAYTEVRNISHNILPAHLEKDGLANTLKILVGQLNQNLSIHFTLTMIGLEDRLPVEIEFNMYSMVWELINNAVKHANADHVTIRLSRTEGSIDLLVADDGVGLNPTQVKRGNGLQNIHTRLESLGGTINTSKPIEKGTLIIIKIPIETVCLNGNALSV
jgi:signal transduction histidine kinase